MAKAAKTWLIGKKALRFELATYSATSKF